MYLINDRCTVPRWCFRLYWCVCEPVLRHPQPRRTALTPWRGVFVFPLSHPGPVRTNHRTPNRQASVGIYEWLWKHTLLSRPPSIHPSMCMRASIETKERKKRGVCVYMCVCVCEWDNAHRVAFPHVHNRASCLTDLKQTEKN